MLNKYLFRTVFIGLTLFGATPAFSQQMSDAARIAQMEATIRELNLQIATLIKENERLSNEMKSALSSQREGKRVVKGCDISDAQKTAAFQSSPSYAASALGNWVQRNGGSCSKEQLREILNNAERWYPEISVWSEKYAPKIKFFMNN